MSTPLVRYPAMTDDIYIYIIFIYTFRSTEDKGREKFNNMQAGCPNYVFPPPLFIWNLERKPSQTYVCRSLSYLWCCESLLLVKNVLSSPIKTLSKQQIDCFACVFYDFENTWKHKKIQFIMTFENSKKPRKYQNYTCFSFYPNHRKLCVSTFS